MRKALIRTGDQTVLDFEFSGLARLNRRLVPSYIPRVSPVPEGGRYISCQGDQNSRDDQPRQEARATFSADFHS